MVISRGEFVTLAFEGDARGDDDDQNPTTLVAYRYLPGGATEITFL
jgi:hypothetical protein